MVKRNKIFHPIDIYIKDLIKDFDTIPAERKHLLEELAGFVNLQAAKSLPAKLVFICTHNSRRSHLSQIWAQTAAYYYGIKNVECYSGGTEATAFNLRAVQALQKIGFKISASGNPDNPTYKVEFAEDGISLAYSKRYDDPNNPSEGFCAVMTCSDADENCPVIPGASLRLPISYDDPKDYDNTSIEKEKYEERCKQIGTEILYAFSTVGR